MTDGILALVFLYAAGFGGFLTFRKLKLPLPALLGALAATAALAAIGRFPRAPVSEMSAACKIVMGITVGRRVNRESVRMLAKIALPALGVSLWMVALSVFLGFTLSALSGLPLSTTLIGASTGGVNEMAIFALSMNYDVATITIISVTRLVAVLMLTPWIAKAWANRRGVQLKSREGQPVDAKTPSAGRKITRGGVCALIFLSSAGGFLFESLGVPAGFMLGSLLFSGVYSLCADVKFNVPGKVACAAQIGLGIAIGERFGPQQIAPLANVRFLASLVACTSFSLAGTVLLAYFLHKGTKWDPLTCLLSTSAGGLTQMIAVSEEMKADSLIVGILHLTRYLVIVYCMPIIIRILIG